MKMSSRSSACSRTCAAASRRKKNSRRLSPLAPTFRLPITPTSPRPRLREVRTPRHHEREPRGPGKPSRLSVQEYRNYYALPTLRLFALGIGAAAPVANTPADRGIRHWIQTRAHGHVESLAELFNYGGQVWVALPVGLEIAALCGKAP